MTNCNCSCTCTDNLPHFVDPKVIKLAVEGIDLEQALNCILLTEETYPLLYGPSFSPTKIRYIPGSRPKLEKIANSLEGNTPREKAISAMHWIVKNVLHPYLAGYVPKNRTLTEEEIVESGFGWCSEQGRLFVALCEVMGIPGRMSFLAHKNGICGHTTSEAYLDGKWAWFDPTFDVCVEIPDGTLGTTAEISHKYRDLAHKAFKPVLEYCETKYQPFIEGETGWKKGQRLTPDAGGDLLHTIGICNYIIDGVEVVK